MSRDIPSADEVLKQFDRITETIEIQHRALRAIIDPKLKRDYELALWIARVRLFNDRDFALFLCQRILEAMEKGDESTLAKIRELASAPIKENRRSRLLARVYELMVRHGRPPTKREVKSAFIDSLGDPLFDMPPPESREWARLWGYCGLDNLPD